jgi:hypothetical protein
LEKYGESRLNRGLSEEDLKDLSFVREISTRDGELWMTDTNFNARTEIIYELVQASMYSWPLIHRIVKKYVSDGMNMTGERLDDIIKQEFELFEYLREPFLRELKIYCKVGYEYCASLYAKFVEAAPAELAEMENNVDLSERANRYLRELAEHRSALRESLDEGNDEQPQIAWWGARLWGSLHTVKSDEDFSTALNPEPWFLDIPANVRKSLMWVRLPDVLRQMHGKVALFGDINPGQFSQGKVGNCWLIAALSSAAEFPSFVRSLFETQEMQENGKYVVRIIDSGQVIQVTVNDLVPCIYTGFVCVPMFAKSHDGSMWALLYEKALAKHKGGYGFLDAGSGSDAFKLFNSQPVARLRKTHGKWTLADQVNSQISEIRKHIESMMTLEYIVTAGIVHRFDEPPPAITGTGLVAMHVYSVLRIAEVRIDGEEAPTMLIKLRNPWGKREWTGDWSDSSDKWKKFDVAEKLNHQPRFDDGIFWMPLEEFLKYFNVIEVSCTILKTTCATPQRKLAATIIQVAP